MEAPIVQLFVYCESLEFPKVKISPCDVAISVSLCKFFIFDSSIYSLILILEVKEC